VLNVQSKGKGKAIRVHAWTHILRIPEFCD